MIAERDLWQRKDVGVADGSLSRSLPAHGSALFRVTPGVGFLLLGEDQQSEFETSMRRLYGH
ncbi:hypothetical protein [Amycolatopsis sp. CA-128772]|uniref:hypothetical protein n=1 Tax=Amycolatopsis sp. CA-128772 TaxID=2073159 RepID=UPI000CD14161|nr:hypothetical protein [Amycolatopsis sp. CA-128772]